MSQDVMSQDVTSQDVMSQDVRIDSMMQKAKKLVSRFELLTVTVYRKCLCENYVFQDCTDY